MTSLVIFGISGDLGQRKLLPALFRFVKSGALSDIEIIGVSRRKIAKEEMLSQFANEKYADVATFAEKFHMRELNPDKIDDYKNLKLAKNTTPVFYLSVPPAATTTIVKNLGASKLNTKNAKICFEKPFGRDEKSARKLFANVREIFDEKQIYRVDHYLEKAMAQNLVSFRGANALLSMIWHGYFVERIDIIASEKRGVNGRGDFYEQTGAMRDVIQGHLLQLAALTLMDLPLDFSWSRLSELKLQALASLEPISPDIYADALIRGQYNGYASDVGKNTSDVETFASITLTSKDPTWRGVPIRLIAGKKLAEDLTEIRIYLRRKFATQDNLLRIRLDKDGEASSVDIGLRVKMPGYDRAFAPADLRFDDADAGDFDAYEQVLIDIVRGDHALFPSRDEILQSWRIIDAAWKRKPSLRKYDGGASFDEI